MLWERLLFFNKNDQEYFDIVSKEQSHVFLHQAISNTRALMLGAVLFALTFFLYETPFVLILIWLVAQLGLWWLLMHIASVYRKTSAQEDALVRFMCQRMLLGSAVSLLFGFGLFFLPEHSSEAATPVILLMLLTICIITIFRFAVLPLYFIAVNVSLALPAIIYLVLHFSTQNMVYLVILVCSSNVIIIAGLRMAQTSKEVIILNARLKDKIKEHVATKKELESIALQDYLTGLGNRRLFEKMLLAAIAKARRENHSVLVLYIDLDDFKPINDKHGHDVGDRLLQAVAQRIEGMVRISDTVCRIGGDEFIVVMESIDEQDSAERIVEKFTDTLSEPYPLDNLSISVSASVGMAVYPEDGHTWHSLMSVADQKMYQAKTSHKNVQR